MELDTWYGLEDLYVMLEITTVDNFNRRLVSRRPSSGS